MGKLKGFVSLFLCSLILCGCNNESKLTSEPVIVPEPTIVSESSIVSESATTSDSIAATSTEKQKIVGAKGQKVPLLREGKRIGWVRINLIEKLRFADFSNVKARNASINYSYSINLSIHVKKGVVGDFTCTPVILVKGVEASSVADLGWNGFPSKISFYQGNETGTIEVGVQPECKGKSRMVLMFSDNDGNTYEAIHVAKKTFKNARKGAKLLSAGQIKRIQSVNGAVYSVTPKQVCLETHLAGDGNEATFYDICYDIHAWKAPTNSRRVANVIGIGKNAQLACSVGLALRPLASSQVLRSEDAEASRLNYEDGKYYYYVLDHGYLDFGFYREVWTNRKVNDASLESKCVRVMIEFSEEAKARSLKEMLSFKGRYLVYEMIVTERD